MHIFWNIWLAFALIFNFFLSLGPIVFPRTQDCWWHYLREFTNETDETLHLNQFSNEAMRFDAKDYITHTHYKFRKTLKNNNLIACYYHVMYAFQSEFTIYYCLNAKEFLARNKRDIWSLSGSNGIRTHNHLVRKWTLNHLAKLAIGYDYWLNGWVFI